VDKADRGLDFVHVLAPCPASEGVQFDVGRVTSMGCRPASPASHPCWRTRCGALVGVKGDIGQAVHAAFCLEVAVANRLDQKGDGFDAARRDLDVDNLRGDRGLDPALVHANSISPVADSVPRPEWM